MTRKEEGYCQAGKKGYRPGRRRDIGHAGGGILARQEEGYWPGKKGVTGQAAGGILARQ